MSECFQEEVSTKVVTTGGSGECTVARRQCKLVELDITLASTATATYYAWIFDSNDSAVITGAAATMTRPRIIPVKLIAGEPVSWEPSTKWTPFDNGITIVLSTDDQVFTPVVEFPDGYMVGYHVIYDNGRNVGCGA